MSPGKGMKEDGNHRECSEETQHRPHRSWRAVPLSMMQDLSLGGVGF